LADSTKVTITIYNFAGQFVRNIDLGRKPVGFYVNKGQAAYWDGKDSLRIRFVPLHPTSWAV
jgi:flagellar hook assembly protein FlgD